MYPKLQIHLTSKLHHPVCIAYHISDEGFLSIISALSYTEGRTHNCTNAPPASFWAGTGSIKAQHSAKESACTCTLRHRPGQICHWPCSCGGSCRGSRSQVWATSVKPRVMSCASLDDAGSVACRFRIADARQPLTQHVAMA